MASSRRPAPESAFPRLLCASEYSGLSASACRYCAIASSIRPAPARLTPKLLWARASSVPIARALIDSAMAAAYSPFFARAEATSDWRYKSAAGASMCSIPLGAMLTNSGMLTARLLAVEFSIRMAGVSRPSESMCVRNIWVEGRAITGGRVLDQDGRRVASLRVDVREEHLGIGRAAFGGEHQPSPVRRETVPRVHQRRIADHAACLPARRRDDVELAVGAHQLPVAGMYEDDPAAVGRDLREAVAHAVAGGAGDGLGLASSAVVEGDSVQIILNRNFGGVVGVGGHFAAGRVGIFRLRPREHEVLAVGAPDGIGVHVARVVGSGQRLELAGVAVIPG